MKISKVTLTLVLSVCVGLFFVSGCVSQEQYDQLKAQNRTQQDRITDLESKLMATQSEADQIKKKLELLRSSGDINLTSKLAEIELLENQLAQKNSLIKELQAQLMTSGSMLPAELNIMLEEFSAANPDLVTFDEKTGSLKFTSDLLFEKGQDTVTADATKAITQVCGILNDDKAKGFDVIIAGHTDDVPIKKPSTLAKHPTNWHLSADRAISVLNVMTANSIEPTRLSVRGFGEYRPVVENEPKKGAKENRRVEIFIVPKGI